MIKRKQLQIIIESTCVIDSGKTNIRLVIIHMVKSTHKVYSEASLIHTSDIQFPHLS